MLKVEVPSEKVSEDEGEHGNDDDGFYDPS
jgi:hypothetical protein